MMKQFSVGSWTLCRTGTDDEPKISDTELAKQLGYARTQEVRERIRKAITDKILNDVEIIRESPRKSESGKGRPPKSYMLTEQQALFITAKCETPSANAILKEMIHVFYLARRGRLPGQGQPQVDMAAIGEVIARAVVEGVAASNVVLVEHLNRSNAALVDGIRQMMGTFREEMQKIIDHNLQQHLEATHSAKNTIGSGGAWQICERLKLIAEIYTVNDPARRNRVLSGLHYNLRAAVGFNGTRRQWCHLPQEKWQDAQHRLEEEHRAALRQCQEAGVEPPKQKMGAVQMAFNWGKPADETAKN